MKKCPPKKPSKVKVLGETYREKFLKIISEAKEPIPQSVIVDIFDAKYNHISETDPICVERSTIQSAASRELPKLLEDKKILMIENKYYQIFNRENQRAIVRTKILKEITFTGSAIFEINEKVWAIPVERESLVKAEKLLKEYLKEYCFEVTAVRHMVIVMLTCRKQHRDKLKDDLNAMLVEANQSTKN